MGFNNGYESGYSDALEDVRNGKVPGLGPVNRPKPVVPDADEPTPVGPPTVLKINEDNTFKLGHGNIVTGTNMRFSDDDPGGHLIIKDPDGTEVSAMVGTDEQVPVTESRFGITFNFAELMPEREYTFEFTMVDGDGQLVTVTKTAVFVES